MKRDALIPSMFHRRLLLLTTCLFALMTVLVGRLYQLTIVQGPALLDAAESVLVEHQLLPTYRGRILDRNGIVLAEDRPCFDVAVDYRLINGEWAASQAWNEAREASGESWLEMSPAQREALIASLEPKYERQVERLWREMAALAGVEPAEIHDRVFEVHERVEGLAQHLWAQWQVARSREMGREVSLESVKRPIAEQREAHTIIACVPARQEAEYLRLAATGPQIRSGRPAITLKPSGTREYPWRTTSVRLDRSTLPSPIRHDEPLDVSVENVAVSLLGGIRDRVYREDIESRPLRGPDGRIEDLGGYEPKDRVGASGLEAAFEHYLRGERGLLTLHLDTETADRIDPRPGGDLTLTLDVRLQARVQAVLSPEFGLTRVQSWHSHENGLPEGWPLSAAAVVLDVETGQVLALASQPPHEEWVPHYDPQTGERTMVPLMVNRALEKPYPTGSIVKPLLLCAAVTEGVWDVGRVVSCTGHYFPNQPTRYRCWIYRPEFGFGTHGPLGATEAIARSCNIYFYTIGAALGPVGLNKWYRQWGIDKSFDLGVPSLGGLLEPVDRIEPNEAIMMGIGQGPVAWTPLHAAAAYAALARGGVYVDPTLVIDDPRGRQPQRVGMRLDARTVQAALDGLSDVVNAEHGGAHHVNVGGAAGRRVEPIFNAEGVRVWGKTGTAQQNWPTRVVQLDESGRAVLDASGRPVVVEREPGIGTHSWFVGLAGPDDGSGTATPKYSIAVLVEWGGSGSRAAGPIANQIVHALKAEGYL